MAKIILDSQYLTSSVTIVLEILARHIASQLKATILTLSYILIWPLVLELCQYDVSRNYMGIFQTKGHSSYFLFISSHGLGWWEVEQTSLTRLKKLAC